MTVNVSSLELASPTVTAMPGIFVGTHLKKALQLIADHYDHSLIYEKNTLKPDTMELLKRDGFRLVELPFRPTAENLSRHFFMILKERGFRPHNVTVYETPNNCAMYEEG